MAEIAARINESPAFKKLQAMEVPPFEDLLGEEEKATQRLPLIDEMRLGACKLEKIFVDGASFGAK